MRAVATVALTVILIFASAWLFAFGVFLFGGVGKFIALPFVIYLGHIVIDVILDMYYQEEE